MLHILPTKIRNEQREQHFLWVKMIRAILKVIPWPETHVIHDRLQNIIIMVFLATQCSKFKKNIVLNKATNHEVTKQKAKIAKVADVSTSQMLHCSRFLLINILSFRASFLLSHSSVFFFQSNCLFLLSQTQQIAWDSFALVSTSLWGLLLLH